ncbi:MAG: hypothetical protein CMJ35_15180 [Phycisphaerae bacterium]|nr:hypothetical protein [Phycisphaerae bacterium]MBM92932.1 hypothetical protein [Phycisphaerae bacterium]|tara:strand:+ start:317 stop:733 length:417 start_codon:yes stop_codon:yes gene_type:complete
MKINAVSMLCSLAMCSAAALAGPSGGGFEITWYTIDAGGTMNSSGDGFELSGTIGQPDAGPVMTGGQFSLAGGFWPGVDNAPACPADLTGDGMLNFFDVSAFLSAFGAMEPIADFTGDGMYNFFDVSAFLSAFANGCP